MAYLHNERDCEPLVDFVLERTCDTLDIGGPCSSVVWDVLTVDVQSKDKERQKTKDNDIMIMLGQYDLGAQKHLTIKKNTINLKHNSPKGSLYMGQCNQCVTLETKYVFQMRLENKCF